MVREWTVIVIAVAACGCPGFGDKTIEELLGPPGESPPTWEADIQPLFADACIQCHTLPPACGAPEGFRLDKYERAELDGTVDGAFERRELIVERAVDGVPSFMPLEGALPPEQRQVIDLWFMAGAPR